MSITTSKATASRHDNGTGDLARGRKHLIWKECRLLLPACLGLLSLAAVGMLVVGCFAAQSLNDNSSMFIGLALGGAVMAALVCGAMTFSLERENRTDTFLARLPLSGKKLAGIKLLTAGICFFAFYFTAIVIAEVLFAVFFDGRNLLALSAGQAVLGRSLPIAFLMPVMCFLWSLMFSRYLKKTLNVVLLAATCSVFVPFVLWLICGGFLDIFLDKEAGVLEFCVIFLIQIVLLLVGIFIHSGDWLRSNQVGRSNRSGISESIDGQFKRSFGGPSGSLASLAWQTFRIHWVGCLIAVALGVIYVVVVLPFTDFIAMAFPSLYRNQASEASIHWIELSNDLFAAFLGCGFGLALFASDQSGSSYRFFQQRADYPRRVWLSRVLVLFVVGLWVTLVIAIVNRFAFSAFVSQYQMIAINEAISTSQWYRSASRISMFLPYFLTLTLRSASMYFVVAGVGQLVSIYCRHGILNALIGLVACLGTVLWVRYLNWYQAPVYYFGWPVGIGAFLLSWWYAPSWIRGTKQLPATLIAIAVMASISVSCIFGLRADRLNDYSAQPAFEDLDRLFENPTALRNAGDRRFDLAKEMESSVGEWERACEDFRKNLSPELRDDSDFDNAILKQTPGVNELFDGQRPTFDRITEAVSNPDMRYYFFLPPDAVSAIWARKYRSITALIERFKLYAIQRSDSDLYRRAMMAEITVLMHRPRSLSFHKIREYIWWADQPDRKVSELLNGLNDVELLIQSSFSVENQHWLENRYFLYRRNQETSRLDSEWETERKKRKAQFMILSEWDGWRNFCKGSGLTPDDWTVRSRTSRNAGGVNNAYAPMREGVPMGYQTYFDIYSQERVNLRVLRYLKQRLALAAWKQETGAYPKKLNELVGKYLNEHDELSNSYYPDGFELPAVCETLLDVELADNVSTVESAIPSGTPILLPWVSVPNLKSLFKIVQKNEDGSDIVFESEQILGYFLGGSSIPASGSDGDMVILGTHDGRLFDSQ